MKRELNHWGWGYADRFPDRETREIFAKQLSMFTGFAPESIAEPVSLEEARVPSARVTPPPALRERTRSDRRARATRCYGRAYRDIVRGFAGDFASAPDVVVSPRDEDDVRATLEWADAEDLCVVPYGGGTSVVGGVEVERRDERRGVVCLDLRSMDRVLEIDETSRSARIQAGATGPGLEAQLGKHDLTLRFYPQSFELSTLGGWVATRAGGHFATLETHIDDLVESTRMLSPAGVFASRRLPASGAGPSPDALVLGSEGTLGVITEAWLRVRPRPVVKASASVRFAEWSDAVRATRDVAQSGLYPSNCRLLDRREALLNRVASDGSHVLLLGFESAGYALEEWMNRALEIALAAGGTCPDGARYKRTAKREPGERDATADRWREAFLDAPYLINSMVSLGVIADTFETACTWDRFDALHAGVRDSVQRALSEVCGGGSVSCRFTHVYPNGVAPYYTFIGPARRGSELSQWAEIKAAASEALIAHGGTITHHHAVGRMHRPYYAQQRPAPYGAVLGAVKASLDPKGLLNPGVLIEG